MGRAGPVHGWWSIGQHQAMAQKEGQARRPSHAAREPDVALFEESWQRQGARFGLTVVVNYKHDGICRIFPLAIFPSVLTVAVCTN